jgi:O-antigen/teichoic acid export membrane protein
MKQSTRLIINASSMFTRMALTVGISLLITRLLLKWLGKVDFGLVLALGATGAMLQVVSAALTTGVQRQLAYAIAHKDVDSIRRVFSTGWVVYLGLGLGLWIVGIALTPAVMHGLTIPAARADAAWWVYQISLLNLVIVVTTTPFQAMLVSHQHLMIQGVVDVFTALTRLAAVLLMIIVPWDRMVAFVAFQLAGYTLVYWSLCLYCMWRYQGSVPRPRYFDRSQLMQIFSIAIWAMFSQLSWRFRMQGGILIINIFFGPVANAAYGVAMQLANYATTVSYAIRQTVSPAIFGAHAKGNKQSVHRLALVTGKYVVLLLCFLFVPIFIEAPQVLHLWLGDLPEYTVLLTRLVILWTIGMMFISGYVLANTASGELGWYTRRTLAASAAHLVLATAGFYMFGPNGIVRPGLLDPSFFPATGLLGVASMMFFAVYGVGKTIDLPPSQWFFEALLPTLAVLVPAVAAAAAIHWMMPGGIWRLLAVTGTYGVLAAPLLWCIGLAAWEREYFLGFASSALGRLQGLRQAKLRP